MFCEVPYAKYVTSSKKCQLTFGWYADGDELGLDDGAGVVPGILGEWLGDALGLFDGVHERKFSAKVYLYFDVRTNF